MLREYEYDMVLSEYDSVRGEDEGLLDALAMEQRQLAASSPSFNVQEGVEKR